MPRARARRLAPLALALGLAALSAGCGGGSGGSRAGTAGVPAYVTEPFTEQQERIARGGHLITADGCTVCHLSGRAELGPDFWHFAGHHVRLDDGRSVLVDEALLREGLTHPERVELRGYDPAPMLAALARLDLAQHPQDVTDLAAFIEEIGPESE